MSEFPGPDGTQPELSLRQHEQLFGFLTELATKNMAATDIAANLESLKSLPGVEPRTAVIKGQEQDIPASGWLVRASLDLGYGGVINAYQYKQGGFSAKRYNDSWGDPSSYVDFNIEGHGEYSVGYENPAFPHKDVDPCMRQSYASYMGFTLAEAETIDLDNGGRIIGMKDPVAFNSTRSISGNLDQTDLEKYAMVGSIKIFRMTAETDELLRIVANLGFSMGMTEQGIVALVQDVAAKSGRMTKN